MAKKSILGKGGWQGIGVNIMRRGLTRSLLRSTCPLYRRAVKRAKKIKTNSTSSTLFAQQRGWPSEAMAG